MSVGGDERGIRGSGLGLVICKGLVEAHGGRIRAGSDGTGQDTRITFTIPVADEVRPRAAAGSVRSSARPSPDTHRAVRQAGAHRQT